MCVIMIVGKDGPRPTAAMTAKAWGRNDDGGGVAWRETTPKGEKVVKWRKDLTEKEMDDLCQTLPLPYVAHWRIASCGGVLAELTHPFPIERNASLALEGTTKGHVLFHNGTWGGWDDAARYAAMQKGLQIPTGKWSDSRAMAWLCSIYGLGFMELLPNQRGVAFGPTKMEVFTGPGWTKVNGLWCSNDHFMSFTARTSGNTGFRPMCQYAGCVRQDLDSDKRCPAHPKTSFPTNGYEKPAQTAQTTSSKVPEVATASPTPFHPIISVELAEMLHRQIDKDGKRRLSKNLLKDIKKMYSKMAMGGPKGLRARKQLALISPPLLTLCGLPR